MIKSLRLTNFQSHKDSLLEFSPGVNVIVGPSRNGKTSVLRALRWVVENRPAGDEFIRHGTNTTSVIVRLDGDRQVGRVKTKGLSGEKGNAYILDGSETFAGFGQDVPRPVAEALNLAQLNLQQQFETPFLLFDSPGQVARTLNAVVHLEKIDTALANVNSYQRQNTQDIRNYEGRLATLTEAEAGFPDLVAAEEQIAKLEEQWQERNDKDYTKKTLAFLQESLALRHSDIKKIAKVLTHQKVVEELLVKRSQMDEKGRLLTKVRDTTRSLKTARALLVDKHTIIKQMEDKYRKEFPDVCPLCERPMP